MGLDQWIEAITCDGEIIRSDYRKVNWLRNWVVQNTLLNEDSNCEAVIIPMDSLKELYQLCTDVLNENQRAEELLPTTGGFFFGSLDYDECYFDEVEDVRNDIKEILELEECCLLVTYEDWW